MSFIQNHSLFSVFHQADRTPYSTEVFSRWEKKTFFKVQTIGFLPIFIRCRPVVPYLTDITEPPHPVANRQQIFRLLPQGNNDIKKLNPHKEHPPKDAFFRGCVKFYKDLLIIQDLIRYYHFVFCFPSLDTIPISVRDKVAFIC